MWSNRVLSRWSSRSAVSAICSRPNAAAFPWHRLRPRGIPVQEHHISPGDSSRPRRWKTVDSGHRLRR
jgi:hypothetical protein